MPRPKTPSLAVDLIIELIDRPQRPIILIERGRPPFGWALPGGFVDVGESIEQAGIREAMEETGLHITLTDLLYCYSDPERDARGHTVSAVFVATARGLPKAGDDAAQTRECPVPQWPHPLVFDHAQILADYQQFRDRAVRPRPAFRG